MKKSLAAFFLSTLVIILSFSWALASEPVVLKNDINQHPLRPHIEYLIDKEGTLELTDLFKPEYQNKFNPLHSLDMNFGFTTSIHWLKFTLINPFEEPQDLLLEHAHPHMDSVKIYLVRDGQVVSVMEGGDSLVYDRREIDYQNLVFRLRLPAKSTTKLYIRNQTRGSMQTPLTIWRPVAFAEKVNKEQMFLGLYFGVMFAMFFYNFFLFVFLRDKNYLYYIIYLGLIILVQLGIERLDVEYLWPNWPEFANLSFPAFYNLVFFFGGLFSRSFLDTKMRTPFIDKLILLSMGISLYGFAATLLIGYNAGFTPVLYILGIFVPVLLLAAGIQCWRTGLVTARYYTIAWTALLISAFVFNLRNIGVLPVVFVTDYSVYFGTTIEVVFLSLALGDRINAIKQEKILAQQQAYEAQQLFTNELEAQVRERTLELEKSNRKLEQLSNLDGLTGLFNRRYFDLTIDHEWRRLRREGRPLSLILGDIDFFKLYNDTYGHLAGDSCLRAVADVIKHSVNRPADVAARYGGEEFALILPDVDGQGAEHLAKNISTRLEEKAIVHEASTVANFVTMSFGIATMIPDNASSPETLISLCDKALYQSKEAGRNTVSVMACQPFHPNFS